MSTGFQELCMTYASCPSTALRQSVAHGDDVAKEPIPHWVGNDTTKVCATCCGCHWAEGTSHRNKRGNNDTWWLVLCWPGKVQLVVSFSQQTESLNLSQSLSLSLPFPIVLIRLSNFFSNSTSGNCGFILFSSWCRVFSTSNTLCNHLFPSISPGPTPATVPFHNALDDFQGHAVFN